MIVFSYHLIFHWEDDLEFEEDNQENAEIDQETEIFDEEYMEEEINEKKEENYMKYLIGIAIVIGVGWYLISEPFSTKVDRAIDENSNWNPTTILEDPDAYIYGALQHLDNLEKNLKEEKFRVNTRLNQLSSCLLYTSPSPRDRTRSRMPSSA